MLSAMKRGYTALEFKSIIRKMRAVRPDLTLSSDFIVGFPGETEADFEKLLKMVADLGKGKISKEQIAKQVRSNFLTVYLGRNINNSEGSIQRSTSEADGVQEKLQDSICSRFAIDLSICYYCY
jgi:coproporphyrinogen III oxidase-like Fe-S oxidoreductase